MTFSDNQQPAVCGTCNEHERPELIQIQHEQYLDFLWGAFNKCPDCGNVFQPPETFEDTEHIHTNHPGTDEVFGNSILDQIQKTFE